MAINELASSNISSKRVSVAEYIGTPPVKQGSAAMPLRDIIAKGLEDANLFYLASFDAPTDIKKIWLDLNGTAALPDSVNTAGVYKIYKAGAWGVMTPADIGIVLSRNISINATLARDANDALGVAGGGGGASVPAFGAVGSIISAHNIAVSGFGNSGGTPPGVVVSGNILHEFNSNNSGGIAPFSPPLVGSWRSHGISTYAYDSTGNPMLRQDLYVRIA